MSKPPDPDRAWLLSLRDALRASGPLNTALVLGEAAKRVLEHGVEGIPEMANAVALLDDPRATKEDAVAMFQTAWYVLGETLIAVVKREGRNLNGRPS